MSSPAPELPLAPFDDRPAVLTAMFAGALGLLDGVRGVESGLSLPFLYTDDLFWAREPHLWVSHSINAFFAIPLLIGGILIVLRKKISRALLGIGGIGSLAATVTQIVLYHHANPSFLATMMSSAAFVGGIAIRTAATVTMLVLIFLPSTSRWLGSVSKNPCSSIKGM